MDVKLNEARKFILESFKNCEEKTIEGVDSIFYIFEERETFFELDNKNKYLWVNYQKIWEILKNEYYLHNIKIIYLLHCIIEEEFKLKDYTPKCGVPYHITLKEYNQNQ